MTMAETSRQPYEGSIVTRIENKLFEEKDSRFWRATLDLQDHYVINRSTSSITFHPSHDPVAPDECLVLDHTQEFPVLLEGDCYYFEVNGRYCIGWVAKEEFSFEDKRGDRRGMFYNGAHLVNGKRPVHLWYTENVGDTTPIGSMLVRNKGSISVYFFANGVCMGCAYKLTDQVCLKRYWYPCVRIRSTDRTFTLRYEFPQHVPDKLRRNIEATMRPKGFTDSFRGTWLLTQMIFDAVPQQVPQSTTIDIRRHDMLVLNVFYRLTKHTSLGLLLTEINTNYSDLRPFYYVTASNVRCRNDGPELALLQRQLDHAFENVTHLAVREEKDNISKQLVAQGTDFELRFSRVTDPDFTPLDQYEKISYIF